MWAQVPLRLSLQPLLLESLWRRWASSKMILSKKLSTVTSTSTSTSQRVSIKSLSAKQEKKRNWKDNVETPSEGQYSDGRSASSWYCKPPNSKERIARMTKANASTQLCTWRALELNCGAWLHLRPHQHDCPHLSCLAVHAVPGNKGNCTVSFCCQIEVGSKPPLSPSHRMPGTLWLLQVLNQGQSHQCTWVRYLRAGIIKYLLRPSSPHL